MRKIFSFLLLLLMAVMSVNMAHASTERVAGGDGWSVYDVDGEYTLYISDLKHCKDYASSTDVAWAAYNNQITSVLFLDEVGTPSYIGLNMFANMPELESVWGYQGSPTRIGINAFRNCPKLERVSFSSECTSVGEKAFENCSNLETFNLPLNGPIDKYAFHGCYSLKHMGGNITSIGEYAFANCTGLYDVELENCTTIGAHAFDGCTYLYTTEMPECTSIGEAAFKNCANLGCIKALKCRTIGKDAFENCQLAVVELGSAIQSIGDYAFDYGIRDNGWLKIDRNTPPALGNNVFNQVNCYSILLLYPEGTAGNWNVYPWNDFKQPAYGQTPNICLHAVMDYDTNTLTFYYGDMNQTENAIENWKIYAIYSVVTKIVIDPSVANAPLTTLKEMFYNFSKVTEIEGFEYFNTKNVTSMESMFSNCNALETIDLSRLNTSNVTNMSMMFSFCRKLQSLDLTRIDMTKVTDVSGMFYGSSELTTLYCDDDWSTNSTISNSDMLFTNCRNLVGGNGTAWDANYVDKSYARPDGDNDQPGYFTRTIVIPDMPDTEGIDNVQSDKVQGTKVIRDGMLFIERNGKTYNAQGVEMK